MSELNRAKKLSRRELLHLLAASAGGWLLYGCAQNPEALSPTQKSTLVSTKISPTGIPTGTPVSAPTGQESLPPGFEAGRVTPQDDFFTTSFRVTPQADPANRVLRIEGLVENPLQLTMDDIKARPVVERMHTLECIGNTPGGWLIGNTRWQGVSLPLLLMEAGLLISDGYLIFISADAYKTSVPLSLGMADGSMLAYGMAGNDLPLSHGSPLRILLPGVYGQKQPKWINSIRVAEEDQLGVWEKQGWSNKATIQTNTGMETPHSQQEIPAGRPFYITGWAMSDSSGVDLVEISVDDGKTWQPAEMLPGPNAGVWTLWYWVWGSPLPGKYALLARATNGDGEGQRMSGDLSSKSAFPRGTNVIKRVLVDVV